MNTLAQLTLNDSTGVSIGVLVTIIGTIVLPVLGFGVAFLRRFDRLEDKQAQQWSVKDQVIFSLMVGKSNPTLNMPDPESIAAIGKDRAAG